MAPGPFNLSVSPLRTTFLLAAADTYGGDRVIGRYARELAGRGHRVRILSLARPRSLRFYGDVPVDDLGMESFPSAASDYVEAAVRAVAAADDPDVVVATWTPTLPVALAVRALGRASRLVWLAQDYPEMFEGLPLERRLLERGARAADVVVAVSEACARHHGAERFPDRFRVIHSGIDEPFLAAGRKREAAGSGEGGGILFVGGPLARKGWPEFVRAMEILHEAGHRFPVTVVSSSEPETWPPQPTRVRSGLADEELARLYGDHAAYACASRAEGWGLPALEAMAVGAPVVTTLHEGCRAYARPGENCLGVPVGDPRALAGAVARVLEEPDLARRLAREGRDTARRFTWPRAVERFEAACEGR